MTNFLGEGVKVINMIIALKLSTMDSCYGNISGNKCWMEDLLNSWHTTLSYVVC